MPELLRVLYEKDIKPKRKKDVFSPSDSSPPINEATPTIANASDLGEWFMKALSERPRESEANRQQAMQKQSPSVRTEEEIAELADAIIAWYNDDDREGYGTDSEGK